MSINNTGVLNTTKRDKTYNEQQHKYNYLSITYMIYPKKRTLLLVHYIYPKDNRKHHISCTYRFSTVYPSSIPDVSEKY